MMWFGKIELYLIAPKEFSKVPIEDVQRQIIMSTLFSKLIDLINIRENCLMKLNLLLKHLSASRIMLLFHS